MATLQGIEFSLRRALVAANQAMAERIGSPRQLKPDESEYRELGQKLQQLEAGLRLALRELRNMEHFARFRGSKLHELPRDARFGERQSVDSRLAEVARVRKLAAELAQRLLAIDAARHGPATVADMVEGVQSIAESWAEPFDRARELRQFLEIRSQGPSLRAVKDEPSIGDMANVAFSTLMLVAWLVRRLRR